MLLIWIDDYTLHNMDNGVTYSRDAEYNVSCKDASQHNDRVFKMNNIIATGESGKVFWEWLLKQSAIPMPRPEHLTPHKLSAFERGDIAFAPPPLVVAEENRPQRLKVGDEVRVVDTEVDRDVPYLHERGVLFHYDDSLVFPYGVDFKAAHLEPRYFSEGCLALATD